MSSGAGKLRRSSQANIIFAPKVTFAVVNINSILFSVKHTPSLSFCSAKITKTKEKTKTKTKQTTYERCYM